MIMDLRDLQPGDVLNSIADPKMLLHGPIAWGTDNPFVHTAMFEQGLVSISALLDGVQRRPLEQWDRFMLVTRHPSPTTAALALAAVSNLVGVPYDLIGLAGNTIEAITGADMPDTDNRRLICARLIVEAFATAGVEIMPGVKYPNVTPRDIVENSTLETVGYLRVR